MKTQPGISGILKIRVRNIVIPVRAIRLDNGEFDFNLTMTNVRPCTAREQREVIRREWYPSDK